MHTCMNTHACVRGGRVCVRVRVCPVRGQRQSHALLTRSNAIRHIQSVRVSFWSCAAELVIKDITLDSPLYPQHTHTHTHRHTHTHTHTHSWRQGGMIDEMGIQHIAAPRSVHSNPLRLTHTHTHTHTHTRTNMRVINLRLC